MKSRKQVLKKLFLSTLYLSAFTFGGGYVIVTQHSWLSLQEFADLVAIAEMTPRPDCDQRGHVCLDKACGRTRCADSHARLHPAIVLAPDAAFPAVPALPAMSST